MARDDFDVIVVGASLAGSSAATLLARQGARVALVERSPDPAHFKRVCGHFIQASAVPSIERLGLLEQTRTAGAVESHTRLWTRWGWIVSQRVPASLNLRREKLDPLLRALAAGTPGVELVAGRAVAGLLRDGDAVAGVALRDGAALRAPLVVGADGRDSTVAQHAGVPERTLPNARFSYGAYYEGPAPAGAPDGSIWFLDPDWAAAFPTDEGLTLYACMPTHDRLAAFKQDLAGSLERFVAALPDAPPIAAARRVSPMIGKVQMPNRMRRPTAPGLALVGDAALATDPLWGVGCGWAFQTAEWLAGALAPWIRGRSTLPRALRRYRLVYGRRLAPHARMIHSYATGRRFDRFERRLYAVAARDARVAEVTGLIGTRIASPLAAMRPGTLVRLARSTASAG